ncbi:hypothetical protein C0Q88_07635 [Ralstonia pickettii]|uniref:Uncharacterized protein n=1 Tax=Ralstonia pickettii TaxID=329 RepID=A0A2N4TXV1_RALPI|nr:hypothetical protein [Ralstonia pickettii]PLC44542.1 hypothetical protein C0Q88_07635 [Ralstonia pickettii]
MKVHVTPLKLGGIMKQKWMRAMGGTRGVLRLNTKRDTIDRLSTRVAELIQTEDKREWMLFDAELVWANGSQLLLKGYERRVSGIDTITDYAQTWLVRFPAPGDIGGPAPEHSEAAPPTEEQIENALVEAGV